MIDISYRISNIDHTLFEQEEKSEVRLKELLNISVIYNDLKNPWIKQLLKNNEYTGTPKWVVNKNYKMYPCIERLIIIVGRNRYINSELI